MRVYVIRKNVYTKGVFSHLFRRPMTFPVQIQIIPIIQLSMFDRYEIWPHRSEYTTIHIQVSENICEANEGDDSHQYIADQKRQPSYEAGGGCYACRARAATTVFVTKVMVVMSSAHQSGV